MQKGSVNKVVLVGHLGGDPETRYTPSGTAVANFNLATNETWRDSNSELQDKTEWHRCVMFGKSAELSGELLIWKENSKPVTGKTKMVLSAIPQKLWATSLPCLAARWIMLEVNKLSLWWWWLPMMMKTIFRSNQSLIFD
jgi:hypothetical protein